MRPFARGAAAVRRGRQLGGVPTPPLDPAAVGPPRGTFEAVLPHKHEGQPGLNKYSAVITQRRSQGAGQAQLYATDVGKIADGMRKPQVGISSVWFEGNPCNVHLLDVAGVAKQHVEAAGMVGLRFNSIGVSDGCVRTRAVPFVILERCFLACYLRVRGRVNGASNDPLPRRLEFAHFLRVPPLNISHRHHPSPPRADRISNGTDGMAYSLQSRDLIADGIETVMGAQFYDANLSIPGCDKNMPGCVMAMARVNRPSVMVYGGTIRAGCRSGVDETLDIISAFQAYGEYVSGQIDDTTRLDIVRSSCPGPGACGGMYTANTMASAIEALGMSVPYSSSIPAWDPTLNDGAGGLHPDKVEECQRAVKALQHCVENDIKPRDIMTYKAFENAVRVVMVLGGSTNATIHLIAMARAAGIDLTLQDFRRISDETPYIANLKPSGAYVMEDLHAVGGTPAVLKYMLDEGYLNPDCITVTGKTIAENIAELPGLIPGQDVIKTFAEPYKPTGHIAILEGNLAPEGAVGKITGKEGTRFSGPARCFDAEEDMMQAVIDDAEGLKGAVIVIRYEGPKGGPGMKEMLSPTSVSRLLVSEPHRPIWYQKNSRQWAVHPVPLCSLSLT